MVRQYPATMLTDHHEMPSQTGASETPACREAAGWLLAASIYGLMLSSCGISLMLVAYAMPPELVAEQMTVEQSQAFEETRPWTLVMAAILGGLLFLPALGGVLASAYVRRGHGTAIRVAIVIAAVLSAVLAVLAFLQCLGLLLQGQAVAMIITLLLLGPALALSVRSFQRLRTARDAVRHGQMDASFTPADHVEPWDQMPS